LGIITKRMRLVGSLGEREVDGLFDSGASYSLIRREVAEQLANLEPLPQPMTFEMAEQGATVTARERVVLDFWVDGYRFSDEFLVSDNLSEAVVIGAVTMQKWRMKSDMEREEVVIDPSVTRLRFI
jgi:hypothetical protein